MMHLYHEGIIANCIARDYPVSVDEAAEEIIGEGAKMRSAGTAPIGCLASAKETKTARCS